MTHNLVSPRAIVDPQAIIGEGVRIDDFAIIEGNVEIGDHTHIHPGAIIRSGARIGKECEIHPYAVVSGIPQDLKFQGEETLAIIGDRTSVREYCTVSRGTASKKQTIIGDDCLLMAYSHVAHDCVIGNKVIVGNTVQLAGEVEVYDQAILGGGTLVHQFVRIAEHAMIQGGCRIVKDVPPYTLIGRDPAVYCGINFVGLRRRNFTNDQIFLINDIYRTLYTRGLNNSEALQTIESEYPEQEERNKILDFIKSSQRGIVRGSIE